MKKFFFFDLDGTLADTDRDIREAWRAALKELGLVCEAFEEKFVAGPPIEEMMKILFPDVYTPALGERLREAFARHYDNDGFPNTVEYPRARRWVEEVKAKGAKVAIVTNKRYAGALALAAKFGWQELFDKIFAGDMYKDDPAIGKLRKPELLARVIEYYGAKKEECVLVGDTINDFEAAAKCGIKSIGVTWGYGKREELEAAEEIVSA